MTFSRRAFLESTAVGILSSALLPEHRFARAEDKSGGKPAIIDCHTHFYDPTRPEGIPWPGKDDDVLYRPVLPKHFLKVAEPVGVTKTIVIEASPRVEDNAWLLELAQANPSVIGVVGNLAPGEPEFANHLRRFAANQLFRGIRVGQESVRLSLEKPEFLADIRQLAERDLELDVIGPPGTAADVARLAGKLPELRIVINHLCGVSIDGKAPPAEWLAGMRAAAGRMNVFCKVSAMVSLATFPTGAKRAPLDVDLYKPILDATWEAFGDDRLIYGSDWPVIDRRATYAEAFTLIQQYVSGRGRAAAEKYFSTNAAKAYRWKED